MSFRLDSLEYVGGVKRRPRLYWFDVLKSTALEKVAESVLFYQSLFFNMFSFVCMFSKIFKSPSPNLCNFICSIGACGMENSLDWLKSCQGIYRECHRMAAPPFRVAFLHILLMVVRKRCTSDPAIYRWRTIFSSRMRASEFDVVNSERNSRAPHAPKFIIHRTNVNYYFMIHKFISQFPS